MKRHLAIVSILTTVLFFTGCSSTATKNNPQTIAKTDTVWQQCAAVGGLVWGVPAAMASLATGGVAAVAGALASGIGCAMASQSVTMAHFDFGLYDLDMKDRLIIDKVISKLGKKGHIEVVGYTCDIGTKEANQRLSDNRANVVRQYLMQQGIEENRITTRGMGEKYPIADNDSEDNRTMNRRVEMRIIH